MLTQLFNDAVDVLVAYSFLVFTVKNLRDIGH